MKIFKVIILILLINNLQFIKAQEIFSKQDEKTGLYGFVNAEGKYIVKPIYKEVDFNFGYKTGISKVINKNDKVGFVNESGKEIIPCKYDNVRAFENGYAVVEVKSGEYTSNYGLIDSLGREVIPLKYGALVYYPKEKLLTAGEQNTSNIGVMDLTGKWIIPAQYEFWSKGISRGIWPVGKNDMSGVVNMKNEIVIPFVYEMIESYSDDLNVAVAKKDGKYGFIDRAGKTVIPFMYTDAWPSGKYLSVKKDGKWGLIDLSNKNILPFEYSSISSAGEKTAWVSKNENEDVYEIDIITRKKITN